MEVPIRQLSPEAVSVKFLTWRFFLMGLATLGVWSIPAVVSVANDHFFAQPAKPFSLDKFFGEWLYYAVWALYTPVVFGLCSRFPFARNQLSKSVLQHLVFCLVVCLLQMVTVILLSHLMRGHFFRWHLFLDGVIQIFSWVLVLNIVLYWTLVGIGHAIQLGDQLKSEAVRSAQLKEALTLAQLDSLKMSLHPHFLFNTLHGINMLAVSKDFDGVSRMIELLGNLLRLTLENQEDQRVTLAVELKLLDLYLAIQEIRCGQRLRVTREIDAGLSQTLVPNMILQPLVENAIKHGIDRKRDAGQLVIRIRSMGNQLQIEVCDDGPGLGQTQPVYGLGLKNVANRLEILYPNNSNMELVNREEGGTVARLSFPVEVAS